MAGPLATYGKDVLSRVGVWHQLRSALWWYRMHHDRLTGAFVMTPRPLPGVQPGPREVVVGVPTITHRSRRFVWERSYREAFAFAGNWDDVIRSRRPPLEEEPAAGDGDLGAYAHHTVLDMFRRGISHGHTLEYRHLAERILRGGTPRGTRTLADLDAHFAALRADHERMCRGQFGRPGPDGTLVPHRVNAFVGRHGEVIHRSQGLHQLRLAELCGLQRVPVRIVAVHIEWLAPFLSAHASPEDGIIEALNWLEARCAS